MISLHWNACQLAIKWPSLTLSSIARTNLPLPPILENKDPNSPSVFLPSALIREARRQKRVPVVDVPQICILDPDGDIVRRLKAEGRAERFDGWPCYHTDLYTFSLGDENVGILGCVVGAPFAVLIAEELFACGCRILISLTSAGQIVALENPPYFVIIDRALRYEGASYHYAAPEPFAEADPRIVSVASDALKKAGLLALATLALVLEHVYKPDEVDALVVEAVPPRTAIAVAAQELLPSPWKTSCSPGT